jgi:hypothetical protein
MRRKKKNPKSWPSQHPWMTLILGAMAISGAVTVLSR